VEFSWVHTAYAPLAEEARSRLPTGQIR